MQHLLLLVGLLPGPVAAPGRPFAGRFSAGLEGGVSYCNLQGNGNRAFFGAFNSVFTFHLGGYGCYRFAPHFAVQTGLYYSRKGFENPYSQPLASPDIRLDYITLPLLLLTMPTERLCLYAGPQVAGLTSARNDSQPLALRQSGYRRFDAGAVAGAEVCIGPAWVGARCEVSFLALNPAGTATTQRGQPLQLLAAHNTYRSQVLQAYLKLPLTR